MPAKIVGNEKENFTVVVVVIAAGDKLPSKFIVSDKTIRVEMIQIGQVDRHWRSDLQNGW
jgi:hypothetical protein